MRAIPFVGAVLLVALATTGCANSVEHLDGEAVPVGAVSSPSVAATSASPSAGASVAASSAAPSTPSSSPARSTPTTKAPVKSMVFSSNGLGALKLGMDRKEAEATGLITRFKGDIGGGCTQPAHLKASTGSTPGMTGMIYYSENLGVQIIDAYGSVRTPEGIRLGSSLAALKRAYPEWSSLTGDDETTARGFAGVAGNLNARYRIATVDGKVAQLTLQLDDQNCYE